MAYDIIHRGDEVEIDGAVKFGAVSCGAVTSTGAVTATGVTSSGAATIAGITDSSYFTLTGIERIGTLGAGLGTLADTTSIAFVKFDGAVYAPANATDGRIVLIANQGTDVNTFEGGTVAAGKANLFLCDGGTAWYSVTSG